MISSLIFIEIILDKKSPRQKYAVANIKVLFQCNLTIYASLYISIKTIICKKPTYNDQKTFIEIHVITKFKNIIFLIFRSITKPPSKQNKTARNHEQNDSSKKTKITTERKIAIRLNRASNIMMKETITKEII